MDKQRVFSYLALSRSQREFVGLVIDALVLIQSDYARGVEALRDTIAELDKQGMRIPDALRNFGFH